MKFQIKAKLGAIGLEHFQGRQNYSLSEERGGSGLVVRALRALVRPPWGPWGRRLGPSQRGASPGSIRSGTHAAARRAALRGVVGVVHDVVQ